MLEKKLQATGINCRHTDGRGYFRHVPTMVRQYRRAV